MKTRNLIVICIMCLVGGFVLYPLIRPDKPTIVDTDTVYVHRVVRDTIFQDKPVPYKVVDTIYQPQEVTVYELQQVPVDTAMIIAEWGRVRLYQDTLIDNSEVYIHLSEEVRLNRLYNRQVIYETRCSDKIITNTVYRNGFYWGGSLSLQRNFQANLGYQSGRNIYIVGANNKDISFTFLRSFGR